MGGEGTSPSAGANTNTSCSVLPLPSPAPLLRKSTYHHPVSRMKRQLPLDVGPGPGNRRPLQRVLRGEGVQPGEVDGLVVQVQHGAVGVAAGSRDGGARRVGVGGEGLWEGWACGFPICRWCGSGSMSWSGGWYWSGRGRDRVEGRGMAVLHLHLARELLDLQAQPINLSAFLSQRTVVLLTQFSQFSEELLVRGQLGCEASLGENHQQGVEDVEPSVDIDAMGIESVTRGAEAGVESASRGRRVGHGTSASGAGEGVINPSTSINATGSVSVPWEPSTGVGGHRAARTRCFLFSGC
ncbi:hypothetical protein DFH08DRAFT_814494 [Mycena albidolilacea]|uniref:Uncharacterized protein n=1 Tax=Mycena albidolilacea TaxID=1033008 RepID=A0AAD6ZQ77_9AGAR|nr:hypothetical protein DFH08DRAFT_814494 [Mycena albidolilacea]